MMLKVKLTNFIFSLTIQAVWVVIIKNILPSFREIPEAFQEFFCTNIEKFVNLSNGTIKITQSINGKGEQYVHI